MTEHKLSEQDFQEIREEAEKLYPLPERNVYTGNSITRAVIVSMQEAHITAATAERLRAKAEIQALEKEVKDLRFENGVLKKIADLYHNQTNP